MSANPGALPGWFRPQPEDNAQSDAANPTDDTAADSSPAGTTTGGGRDDQMPVVVWEAANRMEAEIVAGRLRSEDIPSIIRGEALGTIYGLTTGTLAAATVLVPAPLAEKALAILASSVEWDDAEETEAGTDQEHDG